MAHAGGGFGYFQISPPRVIPDPDATDDSDPVLVLTHFSRKPTLEFGSVVLGHSVVKDLIIQNPNARVVKLIVLKFPTEAGFSYSEDVSVPPESSLSVTIHWTPIKIGPCRQVANYQTNAGHRLQAVFCGQCVKAAAVPKGRSQRRPIARNKENCSPERVVNSKNVFAIQDSLYKLPVTPLRRQTYEVLAPCADTNNYHNPVDTKPLKEHDISISQFLGEGGLWSRKATDLTEAELRRATFIKPRESQPKSNTYEGSFVSQLEDSLEIDKEITTPSINNCQIQHEKKYFDINITNGQKPNEMGRFRFDIIPKDLPITSRGVGTVAVQDNPTASKSAALVVPQNRTYTKTNHRILSDISDSSSKQDVSSADNFGFKTITTVSSRYSEIDSIISQSLFESELMLDLESVDTSSTSNYPVEGKRCSTGAKPKKKVGTTNPSPMADVMLAVKPSEMHLSGLTFIELSPEKPTEGGSKCVRSLMKPDNLRNGSERKLRSSSSSGAIRKNYVKSSPLKKAFARKKIVFDKLVFVKPTQTSIPHHPSPFVAKNRYYDENWMTKQEYAYTQWLNFTLRPPTGLATSDERTEVNSKMLWSLSVQSSVAQKAPTKEALSLQQYKTLSELNNLRQNAHFLFQSEAIVKVVCKLETEISLGRIAIRDDKKPFADLGSKQDILNMLVSYNPLWLRIGLETVFGVILMLRNAGDVRGLSSFILQEMLFCPAIAKEYAHPNVNNLYREGYDNEMRKFILKKFLVLILFLDKAKSAHIIAHDPCLFAKNAQMKASKEYLLKFSRDYLKGEGDIIRHLRYLGYTVGWSQKPLEEYDYAVTNLAVDLRCGIRLVRAVELLLHRWDLLGKVRFPAQSRTQKISNVQLALETIKTSSRKLPGSLDPRHIVDGNREKTLDLLWVLVFETSIQDHVHSQQLNSEVCCLRRLVCVKDRTLKLQGEPAKHMPILSEVSSAYQSDLPSSTGLLLEWAQVVCALYGVKVQNLPSSFSDGRGFCYLLHHYCPSLISRDQIRDETVQTLTENAEGLMFFDKSSFNEDALKENGKHNLNLAFSKINALGSVPLLLRLEDIHSTIASEKAVATQLSYLSKCLINLSREEHAARVVQARWRFLMSKRHKEKLEAQTKLVVALQKHARGFLIRKTIQKQKQACLVLQAAWRGYRTRKQLHEEKMTKLNWNATIIQACYRGYRTRAHQIKRAEAAVKIQSWIKGIMSRKHFKARICAVVTLQACYRGHRQRKKFLEIRSAAITLQQRWRSWRIMKIVQKDFQQLKASTVLLQSLVRQHQAKSYYMSLRKAAILLQKNFRRRHHRKKFLEIRTSTVMIQQWWKGITLMKKAQSDFRKLKTSVVVIQCMVRRTKARKDYLLLRAAAIFVQKNVRRFLQQKKYLALRSAAVVVQKNVRCTIQRRQFLEFTSAVVTVQEKWRNRKLTKTHRSHFLNLKATASVIQQRFRCLRYRRNFLSLKTAACVVQSNYRCVRQRNIFLEMRSASIVIQKNFRCFQQRRRFLEQKAAACIIQKNVRCFLQRKRYLQTKTAVCIVQKNFRCIQQRKAFLEMKAAACVIQKNFRCISDRKKYLELKSAAVIIQKNVRCAHQRRKFLVIKVAVCKIQKNFKCAFQRRKYLELKAAASVIQKNFRCIQQRKRFLEVKAAACVIQKNFRCIRERKKYLELKSATLIVQKNFRCVRHQRKFLKIKASAYTIQKNFKCAFQRKKYLEQKAAVCVIQRNFRCIQQRKKFLEMKAAACVIQKNFRCFCDRKKYLELKSAALVVQKNVRCALQRRKFLEIKVAACSIQKNFKCAFQRKKFLEQKAAASVIQKNFRCIQQRKKFLEIKVAACVIQKNFRCILDRKKYLELKSATLILQKNFRCVRQRRRFLEIKIAACTIQKNFKCAFQRKKYLVQKAAACVIQRNFRCTQQRKKFLEMKVAACAIQKNFKCIRERKKYLELKSAALVVQKNVRCAHQRKKFLEIKVAVCTIQKNFKCASQRRKYLEQKAAASVIQKNFRCVQQRKRFLEMKAAVCVIQKNFRCVRDRKKYQDLKSTTLIVQKNFRCVLQRRKFLEIKVAVCTIQKNLKCASQRRKYLEQKAAASVIQKNFRCVQQRKRFLEMKAAVCVIQKNFRCVCDRKKYQDLKSATLIVQKNFRCVLQRRKFLEIKVAACKIQKNFKCAFQRKKYLEQKAAACVISKNFRCVQQRKRFLEMKAAACAIQKNFRCFHQRKTYLDLKHATLIAQKNFRSIRERRKFLKVRVATCTIQKNFKCASQRKKYLDLKTAVISVQSKFRSVQQRKKFLQMKAAACTIQKNYKCVRQRKHYLEVKDAVCIVQKNFRSFRQRRMFLELKSAAITIQKNIRCVHQRRKFLKMRDAVCTIQNNFRCFCQRKKYLNLKSAVCVVQKNFKSTRQRRKFLEMKSAAYTVQKNFRCVRERQKFLELKAATCIIQKNIKCLCQRKKFLKLKAAVSTVQHKWRSKVKTNHTRANFLKMRKSAVVIQKHIRRYHARKQYLLLKSAALTIQKNLRCIHQRKQFLKLKGATVSLQKYWRCYRLMKCAQAEFQLLRLSTIKIQSLVRKHKARKAYMAVRSAVVTVQKNMKCKLQRQRFLELRAAVCTVQQKWRSILLMRNDRKCFQLKKSSAILIQSYVRQYSARKHFLSVKTAAVVIQKNFRCISQRKRFLELKSSAVVIQQWWRNRVLMKCLQFNFQRLKSVSIYIQSSFRRKRARKYYLAVRAAAEAKKNKINFIRLQHAALTIQRSWRARRQVYVNDQNLAEHRAATIIQSVWRGYTIRKAMSAQSTHVLENLKMANARLSNNNTVASMMYQALQELHKSCTIGKLQAPLVTIDRLSAMHPDFCEMLLNAGAIPVLHDVLGKCNRSLPYVQIHGYVLNLLHKMAQRGNGLHAMGNDKKLHMYLKTFMKRSKDDNSEHFVIAAKTLQSLCKDPSVRKNFREDARFMEFLKKRLQELSLKETARKPEPHSAWCLCRAAAAERSLAHKMVDAPKDVLRDLLKALAEQRQ